MKKENEWNPPFRGKNQYNVTDITNGDYKKDKQTSER